MSETFRAWDVDQAWLLPPSVHQFVPPGHLAHVVRDTMREALDLSAIIGVHKAEQGQPPYHSGMLVALLLYGYSRGLYSSRQLARACQVASKAGAGRRDGASQRGDETPDWMADKRRRLERIRAAKARLEAEAQAVLRAVPDIADPDGPGPSSGMRERGSRKTAPSGTPPDRSQRDFTDPDSRIMPSGGGVIAGHNGQVAVDAAHQIIIAQRLATNPADFAGLVPLIDQARANLGRKPREVSGDTGFATDADPRAMAGRRVKAHLSPSRLRHGRLRHGRLRHGETDPTAGRVLKRKPRMQAMADALRRAGRRSRYRLRKPVVEPMFGQIKQAGSF